MFKTGASLSSGDGLVTRGRVGGYSCKITTDTGSNISILRHNVLRTVTGATAPIHGKGEFELTFTAVQEFWIAEITDKCILRLDFLEKHNSTVDLKEGVLHLCGEEVPLQIPGQQTIPTCCRVVSAGCVTLPTHSESVIAATLAGAPVDVKWGVMEPTRQFPVADLLVAKTLVTLKNARVPVRVLNLSDEPRKIGNGITLATCVPAEAVRSLETSQQNPQAKRCTPEELPSHLSSLYERSSTHLTPHQLNALRSFLLEYTELFSSNPGSDRSCEASCGYR